MTKAYSEPDTVIGAHPRTFSPRIVRLAQTLHHATRRLRARRDHVSSPILKTDIKANRNEFFARDLASHNGSQMFSLRARLLFLSHAKFVSSMEEQAARGS